MGKEIVQIQFTIKGLYFEGCHSIISKQFLIVHNETEITMNK
jgi:hypothetical protein